MPRTFTPYDLSTITVAQYEAMSAEDRAAYDAAIRAYAADAEARYLSGDLDGAPGHRRYETGE